MQKVKKVNLIPVTITYGTMCEPIPKDGTPRAVFADLEPVTQTEYFRAQSVGMSAEGKAYVWAFEYHGEQVIEIDGQRFAIYRTYQAPGAKKIELYYQYEKGPAHVEATP